MTIAVWGGGFIGRNLLATLIGEGHDVCLLTRGHHPLIKVSGSDVAARAVTFDVSLSCMVDALAGVSVLVHCAGTPTDEFTQYLASAIRMSHAAVQAKVKRVLLISTVGVYGAAAHDNKPGTNALVDTSVQPQPVGEYAVSRHTAEIEMRRIFQDADIEFLVVRIPMVVGPGMSAEVFKRLSALLDMHVYPSMKGRRTYLPCIGIKRLTQLLASLIVTEHPQIKTYQFSDQLSWTDVIGLCERRPKSWKVPLPIPLIFTCATYLGLSVLASPARILLNTVSYADDSEQVLVGSKVKWPTIRCLADAFLE